MATVPTLLIDSIDQTGFIQDKTIYMKLKSLDITLIDPATTPQLHDPVSVDVPSWHGRVSTTESHSWRAADGSDHRWIQVTCTNKHDPADVDAPFGISDAPNMSTTFPFRDLAIINTLADQADLASAEHRATATVYEPGLLPGHVVEITSDVESLSAVEYHITELTVTWLTSEDPEYHLEMSEEGDPPVTLGGLIDSAGCDCPPFNPDDCIEPDVGGLSCVANDANTYSYTEGGTRSGIGPPILNVGTGNWEFTSTDFVFFGKPGTPGSEYPLDMQVGDWGNGGVCEGVFTDGVVDYGAGSNQVRLTVIGPGTMTIHTNAHPGGMAGPCPGDTAGDITAIAKVSGGGASAIATETQPAGTPIVITVPNVPGECAYFIDVASEGALPWGYSGANWTPLSTFEACTPRPGQPFVPLHFTGDGVTDAYNLDSYPYMAGSVEAFVEGVDWTDQITEDDPTTGDISFAYPPPDATDPEPNIEIRRRYPK